MTNAIAETYSFIEFEGVTPMHDSWETIQGGEALIARINKVDKASRLNWLAKHSDGWRVTLEGGELVLS